jgi:urease subunit alpha
MIDLTKTEYLDRYGPSVGDRVHLADTGLVAEVPESLIPTGSESLIGAGKNLRAGMHVHPGRHPQGLDTVITNPVVIDPVLGIAKADIGIRDGRIAGLGNAGNPEVMDTTDGLVIDSQTAIVQGKGLLATPGGIDAHQHFKSPQILDATLHSGVTSVIMMGHAPNYEARTDRQYLLDAIRAVESTPVNIGFLGQGSDTDTRSIEESIEAGMCGLKIHEDHGAYPAVVNAALAVCDEYDVQLSIHTDSINESGRLRATRDAIDGRTVHAFHIEGSGGGHIPDLLELVSDENVLPSSTNPTIPHTASTARELRGMIMPVHQMEETVQEDRAFADARIRESTMAAEEILHETGAIPMTASDSMGMGRAYETVVSTWQTASKMKRTLDGSGPDNERICRYLAKYTINPAITQGIAEYVGSLEPGKFADIVLWKPTFFGAKPERVLKNGVIVSAPVGTENGTTTHGQPTLQKRSVGGAGTAPAQRSLLFTSQHAARSKTNSDFDTDRLVVPVSGTRALSRDDMVLNGETPAVSVDPDSHDVTIDGERVDPDPATEVSLARRYFLH